jgi:membrane protein
MRDALSIATQAFAEWREDKATRLAAALAYYAAFSIAPLLTIVISIVGLAFGQQAAHGRIVEEIRGVLGVEAAKMIEGLITAASAPAAGVFAGLVGFGALLLGAAGVFGQLKDALNTIWEAPPQPKRGITGLIRDRFLSFTMLVGSGFLLMVSLVVSAGLTALESLSANLPIPPLLLHVVNFLVSTGVITVLFALIYKVLPDVHIEWRDVWVGAAITAIMFTIGKSLIGLYLGRSGISSVFGAAGSLIVLLIWVYYSAQIVLFGAEVTQVYASRRATQQQIVDRAAAMSI